MSIFSTLIEIITVYLTFIKQINIPNNDTLRPKLYTLASIPISNIKVENVIFGQFWNLIEIITVF